MQERPKKIIETALTVGLALTLLAYLNHPQEFKNTVLSLTRSGLDCGPNLTPQTAQAILVPGAGRYFDDETGKFNSVTEQRQRLLATAILLDENPNLKVILLNGQPHPDDLNQTQSEIANLQKAYQLVTNSDKIIPLDHIILDDNKSTNTATNLNAASKIADKYHLDRFILVSNQWHDRSIIFACNNDLKTTFFPAEKLIAERFGKGFSYLSKPVTNYIRVKEAIEKFFTLYDPHGNIVTKAKGILEKTHQKRAKTCTNLPKVHPKNQTDIWHESIFQESRKKTRSSSPKVV